MTNNESFEVEEEFLLIGRTFEEYRRMFGLGDADLAGKRVLDCGGGPSSFTAVANAVGADAVSVDPTYGPPAGELEAECAAAVEANIDQLGEKRDLFVWEYYPDVDTRRRFLESAYNRFLADYARNPERYVEGGLPELSFGDDEFDLAVCSNLLFVYDDRLDLDFHHAALAELTRVAGEVRVFPPASLDRERSEYVEPVVSRLEREGHDAELREVPYEFQPGVTETLVVT